MTHGWTPESSKKQQEAVRGNSTVEAMGEIDRAKD